MYYLWIIVAILTLFESAAYTFDTSQPPPGALRESAVRIDLDSIRTRDTLRVITRNTATTYFLFRGGERGFEYELAREFANRLGVELKMVVAPSWDDMIPYLLDGKGDVIAPGFVAIDTDAAYVSKSRSYDASPFVIVTSGAGDSLKTLDDLVGKTVHVCERGPAYFALKAVNEQFNGKISIVTVPSEWDTEMLLAEIAEGKIALTVAPLPVAQLERTFSPELHIGPALGEPDSVSWYVRANSPELLRAVNDYLAAIDRSLFYNLTKNKYFLPSSRYARYKNAHNNTRRYGHISAYDALFQRAGRVADLDWRLLAAQAYQESGFNSRARSWMGAIGLMQLMPATAEGMNVRNPWNPTANVMAGARYLADQIARFDSLDPVEAVKFGLASYNAGWGHVQDARALAEKKGLDPDRWTGHVEIAMPLLAYERYHRGTVYGYARGSETVNYVRKIMRRWEVYRAFLERPNQVPIL